MNEDFSKGYPGKIYGVNVWRIEGEKIDGSLIVEQDEDDETGQIVAVTADGRSFYWERDSYRDEPHTPLILDGRWVKC